MSSKRRQVWVALIVAPIALLIAFVAALYSYMAATATPIHADSKSVPARVAFPPAAPWAAAVDQARLLARAAVVDQNLPGLSVAVGAGGQLVWAEGLGWADLEKHLPVAPETRFRVADASNVLTSAGVGVLLEQNRLHLDDAIQVYVPEFPRKQWPVTLRQLMGHLGGVRADAGDEEPLSERCNRTVDGLRRFADRPLLFEPGTRYRRSTYGWILVSAAVEAAAAEPFFSFMSRQVFTPLRMTDTEPDFSSEPIADRATFYYPSFAGNTRYGPEPAREGDYSCFAGAGAFLSTPSDLVRFGMAMNAGRLLQPATVEMLQTRQSLASGKETDYGLGWQLETVTLAGQPTRMAGHGSKRDFIGGTTSIMTFPQRGLAVAVTSNISFADTSSLALNIAQAFARPATSPGPK